MTSTAPFSLTHSLARLSEIEHFFQQADLDLDQAVIVHKEALQLAEAIRTYLAQLENELEEISLQKS